MFCAACGRKLNDGEKFCPACGTNTRGVSQSKDYAKPQPSTPVEKKTSPVKKILIGVGILLVLMIALAMFGGGDTSEPATVAEPSAIEVADPVESDTPAESSESVKTDIETALEYKNSCLSYDYSTIFRDSSAYMGERAKFTGEVVQVLYDGDFAGLRINVTQGEYFYEDTVWAAYQSEPNESRILEGDILVIYGELDGLYTYESVLGSEITIPSISVSYVENITAGDTATVTTSDTLALYAAVLEKYIASYNAGWSTDESFDVNYLVRYADALSDIGYSFLDFNEDGIMEMLIAFVDTPDVAIEIYSMVDGSLERIVSGGERSRYYVTSNGAISNYGSNSASESMQSYFIVADSGQLIRTESIVYFSGGNDTQYYYFNHFSSASEPLEISWDAAQRVEDSYLSAYEPTMISREAAEEVEDSYQNITLTYTTLTTDYKEDLVVAWSTTGYPLEFEEDECWLNRTFTSVRESISNSDYLLPSNTQYLTQSDLYGFTADEAALARNEIYARYGYNFTNATYQAYFNAQSWYQSVAGLDSSTFSTSMFNAYELANIDIIKEYEAILS